MNPSWIIHSTSLTWGWLPRLIPSQRGKGSSSQIPIDLSNTSRPSEIEKNIVPVGKMPVSTTLPTTASTHYVICFGYLYVRTFTFSESVHDVVVFEGRQIDLLLGMQRNIFVKNVNKFLQSCDKIWKYWSTPVEWDGDPRSGQRYCSTRT